MKKVVVVVGPTATGKSEVSARLAALAGGEIISADSMQVYKGMDIGTAKPAAETVALAPHHLLSIVDPASDFSVAQFQRVARQAVEAVLARGRLPIIVGGSGLYVRAVIDPLDFPAGEPGSKLRADLARLAREDPKALAARLEAADPQAAAALDKNNLRRVITAIEAADSGAEPFEARRERWRARQAVYEALIVGLAAPREKLNAMIDDRVDEMIEAGLEAEVEKLAAAPKGLSKTAAQAIGYKELLEYFAGRLDKPDAIELIKRRTRQFAKRQMTWFKADPRIVWLQTDGKSPKTLAQELQELVRQRGFIVS